MKKINVTLIIFLLFFFFASFSEASGSWSVTSINGAEVDGYGGACDGATLRDTFGFTLAGALGSNCNPITLNSIVPNGTFYIDVVSNSNHFYSNFFTVSNGTLTNNNASPVIKTPILPQEYNFTVYDYQNGNTLITAPAILCNPLGWDVYNINNQFVTHVSACGGGGEILVLANSLPDGSFYVNGYRPYIDNNTLFYEESYSNVFQILNGKFYNPASPYPPSISIINAPTVPVAINTVITSSANFTDLNYTDTHTAMWDWGDGNTSSGTVTESNGSGSVAGSHIYLTSGVYTIQLTVIDNNGYSGTNQFQYVVIYDPTAQGGFLTGSGSYDTQAGWYLLDPQASGKVKFGVQAKYTTGNTPIGKTKFNLKEGNLDFVSTSYQWLVVSGAKATLKGNGTINGSGNYTFLMIVTDGNQTGGQNLIRIQIKDSSNNVVYDTQLNAADIVDPTTIVNTGSIQIHN
nr:PKD domain-containing protein [Candidatus Levybacteria bacterium]